MTGRSGPSVLPQSRVEQAGGYVWWDRVMGELAVSRAIGDHCLRPFVIAEPEVSAAFCTQGLLQVQTALLNSVGSAGLIADYVGAASSGGHTAHYGQRRPLGER